MGEVHIISIKVSAPARRKPHCVGSCGACLTAGIGPPLLTSRGDGQSWGRAPALIGTIFCLRMLTKQSPQFDYHPYYDNGLTSLVFKRAKENGSSIASGSNTLRCHTVQACDGWCVSIVRDFATHGCLE